MDKKKKIVVAAVVSVAVIAAAAILLVFLLRGSREPEPERITVNLSGLSDADRGILHSLMEEFNNLNPLMYAAEAVEGEKADIYFSQEASQGSGAEYRPWRSFGWRLFSRLPTLANLEGEWRRQLILPLTHGDIGIDDFEAILQRGLADGLVPIALVEDDAAKRSFEVYSVNLGVDYTPFITSYPSLAQALSDLSRGEVMFLFWDDRLLPLISSQVRPQHRGFIFPGSRDAESGIFVGNVTWIVLAPSTDGKAELDGPAAFVKYLTSPGIATLLQREYTGEFFSWDAEAVDEELPEVAGPGKVISPQ